MTLQGLISHLDKYDGALHTPYYKAKKVVALIMLNNPKYVIIPDQAKYSDITIIRVCINLGIPFPKSIKKKGEQYLDSLKERPDPITY